MHGKPSGGWNAGRRRRSGEGGGFVADGSRNHKPLLLRDLRRRAEGCDTTPGRPPNATRLSGQNPSRIFSHSRPPHFSSVVSSLLACVLLCVAHWPLGVCPRLLEGFTVWIGDIWWLDMVEDDGPEWALISRESYAVRRDMGR